MRIKSAVHVCLLVAIVMLSHRGLAIESPSPQRVSDDKLTAIKKLSIAELIGGLASENPRPGLPPDANRIPHGPGYVTSLPNGYESKRQLHVSICIDELVVRGHQAFPLLIAHLNDDGYCCLQGDSLNRKALTVGDICYFILASHVRPWPDVLHGAHERPLFRNAAPYRIPMEDAAKWFASRKDQSLLNLQIEAVKTTLEFVKTTRELSDAPERRAEYVRGLEWCARYSDKVGAPIVICARWRMLKDGEPVLSPSLSPQLVVDESLQELVGKPPFLVNRCGTIFSK